MSGGREQRLSPEEATRPSTVSKGVFFPLSVRRDRVTIQERERLAQKEKELEQEAKKVAEDRRRTTLKVG